MVGMVILFLLSAWIILYSSTGRDSFGLEYKIGSNITTVGSTTVVTDSYVTYNDQTTFWVGFLLAIIALSGIFLVYLNDH